MGVHTIILTVTDNEGNAATDVVTITVTIDSDVWLEAECGVVGSLWDIESDSNASNGQYATIKQGNNSNAGAPANISGHITYSFNTKTTGTYTLWARVMCPDPDGDSFWLKMNNDSFISWNNITASASWIWVSSPTTYNLSEGSHTFTVAYREDHAKPDKIMLTNSGIAPSGVGLADGNCYVTAVPDKLVENVYSYPNPANDVLEVRSLGTPSAISLYNSRGQRLLDMDTNKTDVTLDMTRYVSGMYLLKITTSNGTSMRKIMKR